MISFKLLALLALVVPVPAAAQSADEDDVLIPDAPSPGDEHAIVVTGDREKQDRAVRDLTRQVTARARIDKPLSRFYQPMCLKIIGIKPDYAGVLAERIEDNARKAGAPIGREGCTPNALLIFTKDGREAVETLRQDEPWLFTGLLDREFTRMMAGNGAAFAWETVELKGVDGRPIRIQQLEINGSRRDVPINEQFQTGRLNPPIRLDTSGSVVLIDIGHIPGKTLVQLADYATVRLISPGEDAPPGVEYGISTILSLFTAPEIAPPELTRFDMSYLKALYQLRPNAKAVSILDATAAAYRRSDEE
ncbi:MAG: hypothetical protein U0995_13395 [Erythrobacter sp.]|nr:hypothetical protein [Erythrobacter sp.]